MNKIHIFFFDISIFRIQEIIFGIYFHTPGKRCFTIYNMLYFIKVTNLSTLNYNY